MPLESDIYIYIYIYSIYIYIYIRYITPMAQSVKKLFSLYIYMCVCILTFMYVFSQDGQERVFIPSESEKQNKLFHICYNVTKNCYFRLSNGQETIPGWQRGAWRTENMFRKEENDWQMVCFF